MTLSQAKLTTFIISAVVVISMLWVAWWHMETSRRLILNENALSAARGYTDTIASLRAFYTSDVVARVPKDSVKVTHDYELYKHAIPLPATLTIKLAREIGLHTSGFSASLFSKYPFPWRGGTDRLDEFQLAALEALTKNPEQPYYEFIKTRDGGQLRYAVADLMQPDCVECHNSHPDTPRRDWKVGDVRGVLSVTIPMSGMMRSTIETFDALVLYFIFGGGVLLATVIWVLGKTRPPETGR